MGCTCSKELPLGHSEIGQENDLPSFQIPIPSTNEDQQPIGRDTQDENNEMGTSKIQEDNAPFGNRSTTDGINVNLEMIPSKNANGKNENSNGHHSVLPSELSNSISTADLLGPEAGNDKESYSSRASSVVSLPHICEDPNSTAAEDQQVSFMKSFYSTQFSPSQNKDKLLEELVAELNAIAENRSWEAVSSVLLKLYSIVFYEKTPYGNPRLPLSLSTSSALRPHERLRLHGAALLHPLPFPSEWRLQPALRASAAVFLRQQPQSEQTPPVLLSPRAACPVLITLLRRFVRKEAIARSYLCELFSLLYLLAQNRPSLPLPSPRVLRLRLRRQRRLPRPQRLSGPPRLPPA